MGVFARALYDAGGSVRGFKPRAFLQYEPDGVLPAWGHIELVEDIHTQKRRMAELADVFVIFPGGLGTLEEFVAVQMWVKLGMSGSRGRGRGDICRMRVADGLVQVSVPTRLFCLTLKGTMIVC